MEFFGQAIYVNGLPNPEDYAVEGKHAMQHPDFTLQSSPTRWFPNNGLDLAAGTPIKVPGVQLRLPFYQFACLFKFLSNILHA